MKAMLAILLLSATTPVEARCFSIWRYNYPQNCGNVHVNKPSPRETGLTVLPPERIVEAPRPIVLPELDDPFDQRTISQIAEADVHDRAVADHKDEINELMRLRAIAAIHHLSHDPFPPKGE